MIFILLLLPVLSFAQEQELTFNNNFDFRVAVQYDIEPGVIASGVSSGLQGWTGDTNAFSDTNNVPSAPPNVWTNYDTNGLPREIFNIGNSTNAVLSTNGTTVQSRFGMAGGSSIVNAQRAGEVVSVPIPYLPGTPSPQTFTELSPLPDFDPMASITEAQVKSALKVDNVPSGWAHDFYESCAEGVFSLFQIIQTYRTGIRNFFASVCTSIAALHLIWASCVVGSAVFRAIVAGITGVSGGK